MMPGSDKHSVEGGGGNFMFLTVTFCEHKMFIVNEKWKWILLDYTVHVMFFFFF